MCMMRHVDVPCGTLAEGDKDGDENGVVWCT